MHEIPVSERVRGDIAQDRGYAACTSGIHRQVYSSDNRGARSRQHQVRDLRAHKEHLLDMAEDAAQADIVRGDIRHFRHKNSISGIAVPVGKDTVLADILFDNGHIYAQAGASARLDKHTQVERIRSVTLDRYGARRNMGRGADTHAANGRYSRARLRGTLEIQARHHIQRRGRAG